MNPEQPKISVLMAVYNAPAHYVDAAIDSILGQTCSDFEFIIVDDGSAAPCRERLKAQASRDPRIKLHRLESNVGLTRALNIGLGLVHGEYVARQDADDVSLPRRLEETLAFLEQNPRIDAVGTLTALIDAKGDRQGLMAVDASPRALEKRNQLVHGSMMFRQHVFRKLGGYNEAMYLSQDHELYLRMIRLHNMHLGVVPELLYCLRQHAGSLSSRRAFRQLHFSVLAKALTLSPALAGWKRRVYYGIEFARSFFFTHRLLIGPLLRAIVQHESQTESEMKSAYTSVSRCRMCGNHELLPVVDLGQQYLTGIFPANEAAAASLTRGPLELVKCHGDEHTCGLLQLRHSYRVEEMYGDNYGYRSGLNRSMVEHLFGKVAEIRQRVDLAAGDLVIDIGSNDGTTLSAYPADLELLGIDPVGAKFKHFYPEHVTLIPSLFSAKLVAERFPGRRAKVVTSFSMMYDLEAPVNFAREVASILDNQHGIWVLEQSYMPFMLERTAFDTICHEHIEYYGLRQICWLMEQADLRVIDVGFNDVNGGSFSVIAAAKASTHDVSPAVEAALRKEEALALDTVATYQAFSAAIEDACMSLRDFVATARRSGKRVCALGASTKGNVILQHCNFSRDDIEAIGEINPDKFGCVSPGTRIPILNEQQVLDSAPDYLIVLPWHFRAWFLANPAYRGQHLVFPLPTLEMVKT